MLFNNIYSQLSTGKSQKQISKTFCLRNKTLKMFCGKFKRQRNSLGQMFFISVKINSSSFNFIKPNSRCFAKLIFKLSLPTLNFDDDFQKFEPNIRDTEIIGSDCIYSP